MFKISVTRMQSNRSYRKFRVREKLHVANSTRWNSQLKNIRSVFAVDPLKLEEVKEAPNITIHERNIVKDLTEIITPFDQSKATGIELMY